MRGANINCGILKEYLNYLISQELVEERIVAKSKVVYTTTQRGVTVLKYFRELKQALPIMEEDSNSTPFLF
jgi:predicted transcriptional regulator